MKGVEVYLSGVVQGVGFRYFTKKVARELGVKGYVKNLSDGRVYVYAVGEAATLDKFISALRRGPSQAVVRGIEIRDAEAKTFESFEVRY